MPVLIKVPDTHNVRFITGLSLYMGDLFGSTEALFDLAGEFLAIMQDIDNTNDTPLPICLPDNLLKT